MSIDGERAAQPVEAPKPEPFVPGVEELQLLRVEVRSQATEPAPEILVPSHVLLLASLIPGREVLVGPEPRGHFRVQTVLRETGVDLAVAEYILDLIVIEPEEAS